MILTRCKLSLVNGIEIEMLEWKPSGGYRTNGIARVGAITRLVPGGNL